MQPCPCQSQKTYDLCCKAYLSGEKNPETAEELMRSRYTAFTAANMAYIKNTHDPKTVSDLDLEANEKWAKESTWQGLEILATSGGQKGEETGQVDFIARYSTGGQNHAHRERATFRQIDGKWYFVGGHTPKQETFIRETPKPGRNDPCLCGSQKKYKKCCLKSA